jgi:hypothetical protein
MVIPDEVMLGLATLTAVAAVTYARRRQNWVIATWVFFLLLKVAYYVVLIVKDPVPDQIIAWRDILYRPGEAGLFLMTTIFLLNGKVNIAISRMVEWMTRRLRR